MYLNTYTYMLIYVCIYLLRHRYTHEHKHIYKEIYFKGLVHMSVKAGMPKICGSNLGTPGGLEAKFHCLWETLVFAYKACS